MSPPSPKAFTLLELLLVMLMIGILTAVSLGGVSKSRSHAEVKSTAESLVQLIQGARTRALSSLEIDDKTADSFYMQLNSSSLELYARFKNETTSKLLDQENFPSAIQIVAFSSDSEKPYCIYGVGKTPADQCIQKIIYAAPVGEIAFEYKDGTLSDVGAITLTIQTTDGPFDQSIRLSKISRLPELIPAGESVQ